MKRSHSATQKTIQYVKKYRHNMLPAQMASEGIYTIRQIYYALDYLNANWERYRSKRIGTKLEKALSYVFDHWEIKTAKQMADECDCSIRVIYDAFDQLGIEPKNKADLHKEYIKKHHDSKPFWQLCDDLQVKERAMFNYHAALHLSARQIKKPTDSL